MRILIDSHEKKPFKFPGYNVSTTALAAGDYSVYGYKNLITVERKGIRDYLSWLCSKRCQPQLKKLRKVRYRCIIVEGSIDSSNPWTLMDKWTVASKTAAVMATRIPVLFAKNVDLATHATLAFLKECKRMVDSR